ncbi:hypothetical protein SBOR_1658 [Sclerotinia borealis F-4128]|uniref:Uncharacterized protein n=1 Tax=Sclerotinia borealis (strain F-4128) TaxID=1432307 RepID=W9CMG9_SCLBF|nr:hypothetical protein SBOR_1658 [Sclerotinia borealis F-4128]
MSAMTTNTPASAIQHRDIRSGTKAFKRDKDQFQKWSMGARPLPGVKEAIIYSTEGLSEELEASKGKEKYRPKKLRSQVLSSGGADRHLHGHSNITPKPFGSPSYYHGPASTSRIARRVDAHIEAAEDNSHPLSKSLLDLLPTHYNNTSPSIATAILNRGDEGVLYSFDRRDTPDHRVDLSGLVDIAEQKWVNEQTERIVRGEYEVLDAEGETVLQKQRGRKSPRSKALSRTRGDAKAKTQDVEPLEDDGFELI